MDGGNCTICVSGYFGRSCTQVCPSDCKNNVCTLHDGQCIEHLTDTASESDSEHIAIYAVLGTLLGISICCNIGLIVFHLRHSKKMKSSPETHRTNYESRNYQELDVTKVESVKSVYDTIQ
ncbi:uncharacterized protein [Argopecten irradians]|uniref:uncharacterized protein n=1 Tax=Argopecten irradians TaxID=31199 RepID=UPI003722D795